MEEDFDLATVLQKSVRDAISCIPGAERGCLLVHDRQSLSYAATVGYDPAHLASQPPLPSAPHDGRDMDSRDAAGWYKAYMPAEAAAPARPLHNRAIWTVRAVVNGQVYGYLSVEHPSATPPGHDQQHDLLQIARNIALQLERRWLYQQMTEAAQEARFMREVFDAVAVSDNLRDVIHTVSDSIKNVLPYERWSAVTLALLDRDTQTLEVHQLLAGKRPYWVYLNRGVIAAGRAFGVEVEFAVASLSQDMTDTIEKAIRTGVHGVAVCPVDPVAVEPAIRMARDAGIPVITYNTPPMDGSGSLAFIGTDNVTAGRLAGEAMVRLLPEGGKVGIGVSMVRQLNINQRLEGFYQALAGTAIEALPPLEDRFDPAVGKQKAEATLAQQPDLAGTVGLSAANGPTWGAALKAAGKAGQVKVVAFDLLADTIAMLKEGTVHVAIAQHEFEMGYRSVEVLYRMATRGIEATLAQLPPSHIIDTGVDVVTLDRTPWSTMLADHLTQPFSRHDEGEEQPCAPQMSRPIKILVVAVDEKAETNLAGQQVPLQHDSLMGQVMATGKVHIVDPSESKHQRWPEVLRARKEKLQTLVGVPLRVRGKTQGVMLLESARADACPPEDRLLLERIASVITVALENSRLFAQVAQRTAELRQDQERLQAINKGLVALSLSTPLLPIGDQVVVLPLIGAMGPERFEQVLETLLQGVKTHGARVAILDITGVAVVDDQVANGLIGAARAVQLLGAQIVLTGIRPEIAQTLVGLGIDMQGITTRGTLQSGIAYALGQKDRSLLKPLRRFVAG